MKNNDEPNIDNELLASYLSGECPEKKIGIENWLAANPENVRQFEILKAAWEAGESKLPHKDIDRMWSNIAGRTGIKQEEKDKPAASPFVFRLQVYRLMKIAAVLLLIIGLPLLTGYLTGVLPLDNSYELVTVTVENATQRKLLFPDGTNITLDAGSKISYPHEFAAGSREIFLEGEAYFEVAPDSLRPFIVHAGNAVVKVLGTKFNIRNWRESDNVRVVVAEGKVSVGVKKHDSVDPVLLTRGQMSLVRGNDTPSEPETADVAQYLGWMNHDIVFDNAPLREVIGQVERWYDVQITIKDGVVAGEHISVHIKQKSLDDILDLIATLTGLQYSQQGRRVTFSE